MNKGILIFVACVIAFIVFKNYSKKAETAKPSSSSGGSGGGGGGSAPSAGVFSTPIVHIPGINPNPNTNTKKPVYVSGGVKGGTVNPGSQIGRIK